MKFNVVSPCIWDVSFPHLFIYLLHYVSLKHTYKYHLTCGKCITILPSPRIAWHLHTNNLIICKVCMKYRNTSNCNQVILSGEIALLNRSKFFKWPITQKDFPDSSVGRESSCNAGDPCSISGSGRTAGEGIAYLLQYSWASPVAQLVKNLCNEGDLGSIPGLGRSPREGKGYPLQYSGLENSMNCIVHGVAKSRNDWATFTFIP